MPRLRRYGSLSDDKGGWKSDKFEMRPSSILKEKSGFPFWARFF
jgi:hypothetical protein